MRFWMAWMVALLCVVDVGATHWELVRGLAEEANPFGVLLIETGWGWVWLYKVGAAAAFVVGAKGLLRSLWGTCLVGVSAAVYGIVTVMHALVFFSA